MEKMEGKTCLITGANSGIGFEIASYLLGDGAHVIMACRSFSRAGEAKKLLLQRFPDAENRLEIMQLDLGSFESIDKFSKEFYEKDIPLHVLVNNAGILAFSTTARSADKLEQTFAVNHLGPFLLTLHLFKALQRGAPSRIVCLSSMTHKLASINFDLLETWRILKKQGDPGPFPLSYRGAGGTRGISATTLLGQPSLESLYTSSKLAILLFVRQFDQRFSHLKTANGQQQISINAVCPGVVASDILQQSNWFVRVIGTKFMRLIGKNTQQGALTPFLLCQEDKFAEKSGRYFSDEKEAEPAANVFDEVAGVRLWDLSVDLTDVADRMKSYKELLALQIPPKLKSEHLFGRVRGLGLWNGWINFLIMLSLFLISYHSLLWLLLFISTF